MADYQGTPAQRDEDSARQFWEEARANVLAGLYDFAGKRFPADPDGRDFSGATFSDSVSFAGSTFEGTVSFQAAVFQGNADFQGATFLSGAVFLEVIFRGAAIFADATFGESDTIIELLITEGSLERVRSYPYSVIFCEATFEQDVTFAGAEFRGGTGFDSVAFKERACFDRCKWRGTRYRVSFYKATFGNHAEFRVSEFERFVSFVETSFRGNVFFHKAQFLEDADFQLAVFRGEAVFWETTFHGDAWFTAAAFERYTDFVATQFAGSAAFGGVSFGAPVDFTAAVFQGHTVFGGRTSSSVTFSLPWQQPKSFLRFDGAESAYRLAKKAAQEIGDYRKAGDYHYAEQCAVNEKNLREARWQPWSSRFWLGEKSTVRSCAEYIFGRGVFAYGERPLRPLIVAVCVIFACSTIYWQFAAISDSATTLESSEGTVSYFESLYFSVVTFTTLGYGDLKPIGTFFRLFAASEAFIGAALMALFIVSLTRRFLR
jgi:uncharacterized protein YjbI with pentapeptide repeats